MARETSSTANILNDFEIYLLKYNNPGEKVVPEEFTLQENGWKRTSAHVGIYNIPMNSGAISVLRSLIQNDSPKRQRNNQSQRGNMHYFLGCSQRGENKHAYL
jgi:hypothetical protein